MIRRTVQTQRPVKVLVVDDSLVFRRFLVRTLQADPMIEVIADLGSADEAEIFIRNTRPDVITLDLEMPGKSGLDFLRDTIAVLQIPTIVISATTPRGAMRSIEALEAGAVDVIAKPGGLAPGTPDHLALNAIASRAKAVAGVTLAQHAPPSQVMSGAVSEPVAAALPPTHNWTFVLGASTGGVQALTAVLQAMPQDCPPIVIVQHMPEGFTSAFADRLNSICAIDVKEARSGDPLRNGQALIAPGGKQHMMLVRGTDRKVCINLVAGEPVCFSRPAVDVLFASAAQVLGARSSAAVLTGMGSDGALGLLALRRAGAQTFAQDEATSLIYGMPARAWEAGGALAQVPLPEMAQRLIASVGTTSATKSPINPLPATDRASATSKEF